MIVYGIDACPNCLEAKETLDKLGIAYEYRDLGKSVQWLKDFINIREREALFDFARENNYVGIPCFVLEDGTITLGMDEVLERYSEI